MAPMPQRSDNLTFEMIRRFAREAKLRAIPKFTVNGRPCYVYLPDQRRWATVIDNIKSS